MTKRWVLLLAASVVVLAGCSPLGSATDIDDQTDVEAPDSSQAPTEETGGVSEGDTGGADGSYTDADIGTGALEVSGVIYEGIGGQCQLSRGGGTETVDDPYADDVSLTLAIAGDGVSWESTNNGEFSISGAETFDGEYIGIGFSGPRTEFENADLALVWFTGIAHDGDTGIAGEIVCLVVTSP